MWTGRTRNRILGSVRFAAQARWHLIALGVAGFLATLVVTAASAQPRVPTTQLIVDGGFETGGIPNTFWSPETSTNFGTPVCSVPTCGTGGGASPPRTGAFWAWFGGIPAAETATLGQTVSIPSGPATLVFWLRIGTVSSPFTDVLNVRMDGAIVASYPEPTVAEGAYTVKVIDVSAFANGASHALLFEYIGPSTGTGSYVVDDVRIETSTPTAVAVASSSAVRTSSGVTVRWATGSANNLLGFRVYRQVGPKRVLVSTNLIQARGAVAGSRYSFVDRSAPRSGALQYWIQAVHLDGSRTWHGPAFVSN